MASSPVRWGFLIVSVVVCGGLAVAVGSTRIPFADVLTALVDPTAPMRTLVWDIRLPRGLLAAVVGAALGGAGAAYQALFRNPLADPFVIGSSSGAAVGAAVVVVTGFAASFGGLGPTAVGAFVGSLAAVALVYSLAAAVRLPAVSLLLSGAAVSSTLGGVVWLLVALHDRESVRIVAWLLGGLSGRGWDTVGVITPMVALGLGLLTILGRPLDAICCGTEVAAAVGVRVRLVTGLVFTAAGLAVAAAVAAAGIVGFVGLIAPHFGRRFVGAAHRRLIPASALIGACVVLLADTVARTAVPTMELPLGVLTSVTGGPMFLVVLHAHAGPRRAP